MEPLEGIAVAARLASYAGAMLLLGAPAFFVRNLGDEPGAPRWTTSLLWTGAALLLAGGLASAMAQTGLMFGETAAAFRPADVASVVAETGVGRGLGVRLALAAATVAVLLVPLRPRRRWLAVALLGTGVAASFAWTGHGAATEGEGAAVHLAADIVHMLAAALWLGALLPLLILIARARRAGAPSGEARVAHDALHGFSGVGTLAVALLTLTGLVNAWFLVSVDGLVRLPTSLYGQLLLAKLALFAAMLGLAAANRFRLTPALARASGDPAAALAALRRSVAAETAAAFLLLAAVAWLGTLAPPVAG